MRTIGIRELKARLSSVIRDVQRGEHILVTDRGRVVAELRSHDGGAWTESPADRARARLAAQGNLRVADNRTSSELVLPVRGSQGLAKEMLDAERGER